MIEMRNGKGKGKLAVCHANVNSHSFDFKSGETLFKVTTYVFGLAFFRTKPSKSFPLYFVQQKPE